ncbi:hypothetical protein [Thalassotalea marina]|uniref:Uncharacterized protein n=1 Tax=Thalassotalea marina TaxID=1673741 RepID=A0A919BJ56_9GAMM|nr:hypothetical protein [Thalassotalea marina]GHF91105.1 hypothetical protein GCM10017161_18600 [Thalassotalea marina]
MFLSRPTKFEIKHSGRGGVINCQFKKLSCKFNIEMAAEGNFIIFTGNDSKYADLRIELRKYLDSSGRSGWWIAE